MKSSGDECIIIYTKKFNTTKCFYIYDTPKLSFTETSPLKIETNSMMKLHLNINDYPYLYIKYKSNHPEIVNVSIEGIISAIRPGNAIITAYGLDKKSIQIVVISISINGLINNYILDMYNASQYKNVMIVAHPDDEILWGGANLYKDSYFVVCLTNCYNFERSSDFKKILKFTNNSGIILNYPY